MTDTSKHCIRYMKRPFYNAVQSLLHNRRHFVSAACIRLGRMLSDKAYLKMMFRLELRKELDLDNPKTFNEKLQWLKLYYHRPELTLMADKLAVKDYVASIIGAEYVVPLLGSWDDPKDIEWDSLPHQFVLKTNHDGGNYGIIICKDKEKLDREKATERLNKSLKRNTFLLGREWPYKNIPRKVFAERYMASGKDGELADYKFFCFDGKIKMMYVATGRQSGTGLCFDYFDENYRHLDLVQTHPMAATTPEKPKNFELMKTLAEKLSKDLPHVRVDFYEADGKVYFGEFTFFSLGGWAAFHPEEYDYELGSYIKLPEQKII